MSCSEIGDFDAIKVYNHLGDIEYYEYNSTGFLLLPLEKDDSVTPAIAVFNPENLQYITHVGLPEQDNAPWVAVNPVDGSVYTSHKGAKDWIYQYYLDWEKLAQEGILSMEKVGGFQPLDESGNALSFDDMQGGVFSLSGDLLYITNGYWDDDYNPHLLGISVFDMKTKWRIQKSKRGSGYFRYDYEPGYDNAEEPEGLTIWDLNNVPDAHSGVSGQLHVLLLDNDSFFWDDDDVYFKHYT